MKNKGYSLLELVISIFLISTILLSSALAIRALGITTQAGVSDVLFRQEINQFASEMKNGVSSLLSCDNKSFEAFTNAGLVVCINGDATPLENGETEYESRNIAMYTIGSCQQKSFNIIQDVIQENEGLSTYGSLQIIDKKIKNLGDGEVIWEDFHIYDPIKITYESKIKKKDSHFFETKFIITTTKDELSSREKLSSIRAIILTPTAKGANREFNIVFTCKQEVFVDFEIL